MIVALSALSALSALCPVPSFCSGAVLFRYFSEAWQGQWRALGSRLPAFRSLRKRACFYVVMSLSVVSIAGCFVPASIVCSNLLAIAHSAQNRQVQMTRHHQRARQRQCPPIHRAPLAGRLGFFFKVLAGACQFDTAWADLRPNHHHPSSPTRSAPNKQTTTHGGGWRMGRISQTCVGWLLAAPGRMGQVERPPQCEVRERCRDCDLVDPENRSPEHVSGRPKAERRDTPRPAPPPPRALRLASGSALVRLELRWSGSGAGSAHARCEVGLSGKSATWLIRRTTLRSGSARARLGPGTVGPFGERPICLLIRRGVHVDGT